VLVERESEEAWTTAATVGRDSGDVSWLTGVAGGDESGSIVAVVSEGSTGGSVVIGAGDGREAEGGSVAMSGGQGRLRLQTGEGREKSGEPKMSTTGSGYVQLSSGEGGSVSVTSGDGKAAGRLFLQSVGSASLEGSRISAALENGSRLDGAFGGAALCMTWSEGSAGDWLEQTGGDSALSSGGQVCYASASGAEGSSGDLVLETGRLSSASASVASDSQSNEAGDVRIYGGQGATGGANVVVSSGSGGEVEHEGSVKVESTHGGSVSVGIGSSEASGDVVVTTGDDSERSGEILGTTGEGAAGTGKMRTLVLGTTERSADTGGDVTRRAGRSGGTTGGTVTSATAGTNGCGGGINIASVGSYGAAEETNSGPIDLMAAGKARGNTRGDGTGGGTSMSGESGDAAKGGGDSSGGDSSGAGGGVLLGGGDSSLSCGSIAFLKQVMERRAAKKTKKDGKDTKTSVTASPVFARNHGLSDNIGDIFMGGGCTETGVSKEAKDVSEWESCVPPPTSADVVANVSRRDGSVGPINKAKGRGFMKYNTVNEQTPINVDIEHFVHTISAFAVLLGMSFFIMGYAMGVNAIHSTFSNVPQGLLLLIGLTLAAKHKRMLATNLEDVEAIGRTSCTCSEMGTLTRNNFMNGTAAASACTNVLLCVLLFPHHVCKQQLASIFSFRTPLVYLKFYLSLSRQLIQIK
jgi:hypothetical protein